ncbi:hypothetical protein, partial [Komagataeibacter europaeus]|uniref:hypothetical protein n=1 Tax=Komagataeibacter europaeus TaxID=33995 RepID=UPI00195533E3
RCRSRLDQALTGPNVDYQGNMKWPSQTGSANLLYSMALDMLLSLYRLSICKSPAIPEPRTSLGPQKSGDRDAVNRRLKIAIFHTKNHSTELP